MTALKGHRSLRNRVGEIQRTFVVVRRNQHLSARKAAAVVAADFHSQRRGSLHHMALRHSAFEESGTGLVVGISLAHLLASKKNVPLKS